ncbi:hypothetical protein D3C73_1461900 [compost metagenome]
MESAELAGEIQGVRQADGSSDLLDRQFRPLAEQLTRFVDSQLQQVGDGGKSGFFFENSGQIGPVIPKARTHLFNR